MQPWIAALVALFIWWFATGIILLAVRHADRRGDGAHLLIVIAGLPLVALGTLGVSLSLTDAGLTGVYAGFLGALALWGWIELAFLAGVITGPEQRPCPPGLQGSARFFRAFGTVAWHEVLLTITLLALVIVSVGAVSQIALWSYMILYFARIFAKLNLFFGVPRINLEFIPGRLAHLKGYFHRGPVTPVFTVSITVLTIATAFLSERIWSAEGDAAIATYTLLAALSALALLEHWLMVIPLPDAKLWRWMLPAPKTPLHGARPPE